MLASDRGAKEETNEAERNVCHVDGHAKWYAAQTIAGKRPAGWTIATYPGAPEWPYWVRNPDASDGR